MKIATVTFHRALNYGALLQTYALQHVLKDLKHDTEVLDYRCTFIENHYKPKRLRDYLTPKKLAILLLLNGCDITKREQFQPFLEKNIAVSKTAYDAQSIWRATEEYDLFLAGSDQIWNYKTAGFDKNYFLEFVSDSKKKCAYAASLGVESLPQTYTEAYKHLLSDFSQIAVREEAGNRLLSDLLGRKDIQTVLDPCLLLDASEWKKLQEPVAVPQRYVLLYLLYQDRRLIRFAKRLAKKYNCKVLYINNQLMKMPGVVNLRDITPGQWLYLFGQANYIVTNSFHGTVFSILFEKGFWTEYLPQANAVNSRIVTLLKNLQLMDRIVSEGCTAEQEVVDYTVAKEKRNAYVKKSMAFLQDLEGYNE